MTPLPRWRDHPRGRGEHKGARRLAGFNERILSLYARGMSVRDIRSHLAAVYGVEVSPDLISTVTDAVLDELAAWQNRPLDAVWPIIYIDALWIKIRSGAVTSRPVVYLAVGVDMDGRKGSPGNVGRQRGRRRHHVDGGPVRTTRPRHRGRVHRRLRRAQRAAGGDHRNLAQSHRANVCDPSDAHLAALRLQAGPPQARTCAQSDLHRTDQAGRRDRPGRLRRLRTRRPLPGDRPHLADRLERVPPYLAFPPEIRKVVHSTNLIESINARLRKTTRNRGHFPSEQAALTVLYLAVRELIQPRARDLNHVAAHWKEALNAFSLFFQDRLSIQ